MPENTVSPAHPPAAPQRVRRLPLVDGVLYAVLLLNLAALVLYVCLSYKFAFHSDSAAANLLAQEIVETGSYFPKDWNYVNGDLWVFFVHTLLLPFIPFTTNGYGLHAVGGLIGAALILSSTWCVANTMAMSRRARLVTLIIVASGFSANMSENLYGQQAYGTVYFLGCYLLCASFAFLRARGRAAWAWAGATFMLFLLPTWANPMRAAVYNVLPVTVAVFWYFVSMRRQPAVPGLTAPRVSTLVVFLLIMLWACYLGAILHGYYLAQGHSALTGVSINWLSFDEMGRNLAGALQGMISLLSGLPVAGQPVANLRGVFDAMRLCAGAALVFLCGWALLRNLGTAHPGRMFIGVAVLVSLASNLFIFLTTTLPFAGTPESSIRYLVPALLGMVTILVAVVVDDRLVHAGWRRIGAAAIAVVAATAPMAYELLPLTAYASIREMNSANQHVRLVNFLQDSKLEYGYATFWEAGRTTVLAKHTVKVRQVDIANGLPRPMRHLSSDRWYQPGTWTGPSFLLLTREEMGTLNLPELKRFTGEPHRTLDFENYQILVFDHNIARDFSSWQVRVEAPMTYPARASSYHEVGTYDPAADGLVAAAGTSGTLHFGPYQSLESGRYLVSFNIVTEGAGVTDFGRVDVVASSGKQMFGARTVTTAGTQRITLPVTLDSFVRGIEFRVFTSGHGKFMLRNIELIKTDRDDRLLPSGTK